MYLHTHWAYNHPYAVRTWTLEDWENYLSGLTALGYDTVLIWPQLDTMPVPPTASDEAFLDKLSRVIALAHARLNMKVMIVCSPNIMPNERAANYTFETRYYWDTCRYIDPQESAAVETMRQVRREQFRVLAQADGIIVSDSDPGGWKDSPSADYVTFFRLNGEALRAWNADAEVYYWMWGGWPENGSLETFTDTLSLLDAQIDWPWKILCTSGIHRAATERLGMAGRRAYNPYGLVEFEPTFPMTDHNPRWFRQEMQRYDPALYPQGLMLNAQTHCLQLPYTYLAAHYARGGSYATENLEAFAQQLLRGRGGLLTHSGWYHMEEEWDFPVMRIYSEALRNEAGNDPQPGPLGGMLLLPPAQFLRDLADNLDLRADFIELRIAVNAGRKIKPALRQVVSHLRPYRERLGYNHMTQRPLQQGLLDQLRRLQVPELTAAVAGTPPSPDGYMVNLIKAIERYVS